MQEPTHIRAVSFVLALSVVVAGWLFFEYSNRAASEIARPMDVNSNSELPSQRLPPPMGKTGISPNTIPSNLSINYKCGNGGQVSYGDKPCSVKEKTIAVTAVENETPRANNDLERLKSAVSAMENSRLEREKQFAAATKTTRTSNATQFNEIRCQQIDLAIANKDAELRQPHSAQRGDYLTGERKKLMDERFSLRC